MTARLRLTAIATFVAVVALAGCVGAPARPERSGPTSSSAAPTSGEAPIPSGGSGGLAPSGAPVDVATGLLIPWSVVRVGDEHLVSQRDTAQILAFGADGATRVVGVVPEVSPRADGGLLGLAVRESGADVWIYAYHSTALGNRIVRMPYVGGALGEPETVLADLPGGRGHNGGRIAFGPDDMLYAAVGDMQRPELSQDPAALNGKILRMTPEGGIPPDNPSSGSLVYSMGHRNPQGLTWDDEGTLWAAEFGQDTWDELNIIRPGQNYGWPIVEGTAGEPGFADPIVQWGTQESSPSAITYIDGTIFVASLRGERLWAVTVVGDAAPRVESYLVGEFGRLRDVLRGPDGSLWIVTNNTDGRGDAPRPGDDRIVSIPLVNSP